MVLITFNPPFFFSFGIIGLILTATVILISELKGQGYLGVRSFFLALLSLIGLMLLLKKSSYKTGDFGEFDPDLIEIISSFPG